VKFRVGKYCFLKGFIDVTIIFVDFFVDCERKK
jgi:hypothetical protein